MVQEYEYGMIDSSQKLPNTLHSVLSERQDYYTYTTQGCYAILQFQPCITTSTNLVHSPQTICCRQINSVSGPDYLWCWESMHVAWKSQQSTKNHRLMLSLDRRCIYICNMVNSCRLSNIQQSI